VCGKGPIFAEATAQPRLPHLDPTQNRKPEAAPARPVTLLSSSEQYAGFPKSPAQDELANHMFKSLICGFALLAYVGAPALAQTPDIQMDAGRPLPISVRMGLEPDLLR